MYLSLIYHKVLRLEDQNNFLTDDLIKKKILKKKGIGHMDAPVGSFRRAGNLG